MGSTYTEKVVISLGGSLIVPNSGIDTDFLSKLNLFIRDRLSENPNRQFFLITGGGATARQYIDGGKAVIGTLADEDLDWLGIHATRLNAHLVRTIFRDIAHPVIIEHYEVIKKVEEPLVICSGWKPGWSTDFCATMICEDYGVKELVNLSNIERVYDKDPKKFEDAVPLDKISWEELRAMVGDEWVPGMNAPFDPIASKKAQELGIRVTVMKGGDFENLHKFLKGEEFLGTTIG